MIDWLGTAALVGLGVAIAAALGVGLIALFVAVTKVDQDAQGMLGSTARVLLVIAMLAAMVCVGAVILLLAALAFAALASLGGAA